MTTINNFVDRVFCVNLKQRKDKRKWVAGQFRKYDINVSNMNLSIVMNTFLNISQIIS